MDAETHRAGLAVSGAMHLALFAVLVFGFARAPRFDDAPESIPVETITSTQLNEIMEGEKHGKPAPPAKPAPAPKQEKPTPEPPVPTPPTPPDRPEPPKPEPKSETPPPPPPRPTPPPEPPKRPEPPKPEAENAPSPPVRPRPVKPEETPRPPDRPRPVKTEEAKPDKFKPDEIARALAHDKAEEKPRRNAPAFDPAAISKLIGQTKTAEASPNAAPQGLANHHAARMSVSLENALNEWFRDSYKNCWNLPPSNPSGENYVFDVRVTFKPDGSLAATPVMLNPPHDAQWRAHADSVMRAVMRCNPLHVPPQYAPYFDQWRSKIVHFDPSSAEG